MCTLFQLGLEAVCQNYDTFRQELYHIPANTLCDILYHITKREAVGTLKGDRLDLVRRELPQLFVFFKLLGAKQKQQELHWIFQTLNNRDMLAAAVAAINPNVPISHPLTQTLLGSSLTSSYLAECTNPDKNGWEQLFQNGMLLGEFFYVAGWFWESAKVLNHCLLLSLRENTFQAHRRSLDCLQKLLLAQSRYSLVKEASKTYKTGVVIVDKLKETCSLDSSVNLVKIYHAFSCYHSSENRYDEALRWSLEALIELKKEIANSKSGWTILHDNRIIVDVLRQCAKCCAVKREFAKAKVLINKAVSLARDVFGGRSVKYAEVLLDFAYCLMNSDCVRKAVEVYSAVVDIRKEAYGMNNLLTAIAIEELAYGLYVQEYSSGDFTIARQNSDQAISIMTLLLPPDHLQLASAKRVSALILEEIAIDIAGSPGEQDLLEKAESLHINCLSVVISSFGEMNVQTAKHYGNLGRLYQTMKKFQEAEQMHLRAISIKETLLGKFDYEVALSVGHLASLYNYDMHQYFKAEQLHLRSILIGRRLFGDTYSGLEYDYRGLILVYQMEGEAEKLLEYSRMLQQWKMLQDLKSVEELKTLQAEQSTGNYVARCYTPVESVLEQFLKMDWVRWNCNNSKQTGNSAQSGNSGEIGTSWS